MTTKFALGLAATVGLVLGVTACDPTPTDVAITACAERADIVTPTEANRPANVPVYRPHVWPWGGPLHDGATVNATNLQIDVPAGGHVTPGSSIAKYGVYIGDANADVPVVEDVCVVGGAITYGLDHDTSTWGEWKQTANVIVAAPDTQIVGTRIYDTGDGIRFSPKFSKDWAVRGAHIRQGHDDCIENDGLHSGLIEDSFLDGCFVAVSATREGNPVHGPDEVVTIKDSLIRMQPMPSVHNQATYTNPGHSLIFKWEQTGNAPAIHIHDSVFVLEQHALIRRSDGKRRWPLFPSYQDGTGYQQYIDPDNCSNNTIVWLGDDDPDFEPAGGVFGTPEVIPDCFTILTGQAARDFWEDARAEWLDAHPLAWQPDLHPEVFEYDELAQP